MYKLYSLTGVGKGYYGNDYLKLGSSNLVYIGDDGGNLDNLQSITDNGSKTTNIIDALGFKDTSDVDYLLSLNNKHLTIGDVGSDYNGNLRKYFSVFDQNIYPQGLKFYMQDTVNNGVLNMYGNVSSGNSAFHLYLQGIGGSTSLNVNSYYNNSWFTTKTLELGSSGASSAYLKLDPANNELNIQSNNIRFRNSLVSPYVELETSSVTADRVLNAPDESGIIATREWVAANSNSTKEAYIQLQFNTGGSASVVYVLFNHTDTPTFGITKTATGRYLLSYNNVGPFYTFTPEGFFVHPTITGAQGRIMMHNSANQIVFRDSSTGNLVDPGTASGASNLVNVLVRQY